MNTDTRHRLLGLGTAALGGGMIYYFIFRVLELARAGVEEVSYSVKGAALGPLFILIGIALLIFGEKGEQAISQEKNGKKSLSPIGWVVTGIAIVIGLATYFWFDGELKKLGYS
jgi:hypothetical protein